MKPVEVLEISDRTFDMYSLASPRGPAPAFQAARPVQAVSGVSGPSSPPHGVAGPLGGAIALAPEDARRHVLYQLKLVDNDRSRDIAKAILRARPLEPGRRDNDLTHAAGLISAIAPDGSHAEDLVEILYPIIDATIATSPIDPANPPPDRASALDKLTRALAQWRKKRAVEEASADSLRRGLIRAARASARLILDEEGEDVPDRPYAADELRRFEAEHGSPLHWIVQHQGAHYVLVGGRYQGPIATQDVGVRFKEALAPAPLDLLVYEDGRARQMSTQEILEKHSTVADRIVADLTLTSGRYEVSEKTFYEACACRRRIVPAFDPDIQKWLEILGDDHKEKLLDWVASVTRLDRQCCALYLSKTSNTGKSLLAHGLARIWAKAPTALDNVVGAWTADIARCPLIVADEHLPKAWARSDTASAELRALVGTPSRTLTRKFLPNVDLEGCVRVMLLANDKTMLPFDESLGSSDLAAIGGRFLHIPTQPAAAEYLCSLGGKGGKMRGWVDSDQIAAHALFLAEHRQVSGSGRFLVEGDPNGVRPRLITETKIGGLVCEVIARILSSPQPRTGGPQAVRAGGGRLLVSTAGVSDQWKYCIESDPVQSTQRIGRQLAAMAHDEVVKFGGQPYHVVRPEYVFRWALQNHVGDVDAMRAKIDAEPPELKIIDGGKP